MIRHIKLALMRSAMTGVFVMTGVLIMGANNASAMPGMPKSAVAQSASNVEQVYYRSHRRVVVRGHGGGVARGRVVVRGHRGYHHW